MQHNIVRSATNPERRGQRPKRARHDTSNVMFTIDQDWEGLSLCFRQMFEGLGTVEITEHLLEFRSLPPTVATGISLDRQGRLLANMPLHSIESTFTSVVFDEALTQLQLKGPGGLYTYTVPSEILALRAELA